MEQQNILNVTFDFDRCRHSLAVATPVKYECDSAVVMDYFAKADLSPA